MPRTKTPRKLLTLVLTVAVVLAIMSIPAFAGKGENNGRGNGNGKANIEAVAAECTVEGTVVSAQGLPGDEVINFMITDDSGKTGWVLGTSSWWNVTVPQRTSLTTYEFVSRTWGPSGSKYEVFASCSAGA